jgi:hypothetical protein
MKASSPKGHNLEHFIVRIEGQMGVQIPMRVKTSLLDRLMNTLVIRVGKICLYLRADSLLVKISSKFSAVLFECYF